MIPEGGDILDEDILPPDLLPETGDIPSEICEHGTDLEPPHLQPETSAILGGSTLPPHPSKQPPQVQPESGAILDYRKEAAEAMPPPPLIPPRRRGKSKGTGKCEIILYFSPPPSLS